MTTEPIDSELQKLRAEYVPLEDIKPLIAALSAITDTDDWRGVAKALVAAHRFLDLHPEATP